jgi:hypothetical protein
MAVTCRNLLRSAMEQLRSGGGAFVITQRGEGVPLPRPQRS